MPLMGRAGIQDVGAFLHIVPAGAGIAQVNSGDASVSASATGTTIDRLAVATMPRRYGSGVLSLPFTATVASGRSVTVAAQLKGRQSTADSWTTLATGAVTVSNVGSTATFNGQRVLRIDADLVGAPRYLKVNHNATFNSTATGVLLTRGIPTLVLGGADENPAAG